MTDEAEAPIEGEPPVVGGIDLGVTVASILVPFAAMGAIWLVARRLIGGGSETNSERSVPETVNHQARTIPGGRSD